MMQIHKKCCAINPTLLKLSFAPGHGKFHGKRCILGYPNVHVSDHHGYFFTPQLNFIIQCDAIIWEHFLQRCRLVQL